MNYLKHLTFLVIVLFLFGCKKEDTKLTDFEKGLVAYYPFDGNSEDKSGNQLDGITQNASYQNDRNDNTNSSIYFDGNLTTFHISHHDILNFEKEFTIALWIKPLPNDPPFPDFIISKGIYTSYYREPPFQISMPAGVAYRFGAQSQNRITDVDISRQTTNDWEHLTAIFYKQHLSLYRNGERVITRPLYDDILRTNTEPLTIGSQIKYEPDDSFVFLNKFKGNIDEVRLYNRALNFVEIRALQRR